MEELRLVEPLLLQGVRQIKTDRTHRRLPRDAGAGAGADRGRVLNERWDAAVRGKLGGGQRDVLLIVGPEGSEIGKEAAAEPELLRQAERNAERERADIVLVAAERVAGDLVAR